jgi:DNA replication initiation complex subunit (GINS family)
MYIYNKTERILELWGMGEGMAATITYDYLWETYQKEKQTNQLLPISRGFYTDALVFIKNLSSADEIATSTRTNTINILNSIFEKRRQKILVYIAYGKALPQAVSDLEQDFYNKVQDMLKVNKLDSINIKTADKTPLRSLKDIPEVILPSGSKAGPFKKNQIIELGNYESDIESLLSNAICERL